MIAGGRGGDTQTMLLVVETEAKLDALKQARTEIAETEAAVGGLTQKEEKRLSLAQQQFVAMAETGKLSGAEIESLKKLGVEVAAVTAAHEKFVQGQKAATSTAASRAVEVKAEAAATAASTTATAASTSTTTANTAAEVANTAAKQVSAVAQKAAAATTATKAVETKAEAAAIAASTSAVVANTVAEVANTEAKQVAITETLALDRAQGLALARTATGLAQIESLGKVSAGSVRGVVSGVGDLAAGMGPGGPLLTAVAVAGFAIYEFWQSRKKEVEEYGKEMDKLLDHLQKRGPEAVAPQLAATQRALDVIDARVDAQKALIKKMEEPAEALREGAYARLAKANRDLAKLKQEQAETASEYGGFAAAKAIAQKDRDDKEAFARAQKARSDAERDITQAEGNTTRAREDGNRKLELKETARMEAAEARLHNSVAQAKDLAATLARASGSDPVAARNQIDIEQAAFSDTRTRDAEQHRFDEQLRASEKATAKATRAREKRNADAKRLDDERIRDEERAANMVQDFEDSALQHRLQAHGLVEEAEKAGTNREFDRRAAEIEKLKVSEDRKAELLISAALDRTQAVEAIERKHHDALQADILRNAEASLGHIRTEQDKEARQQKTANDRVEREEMKKAELIQRILVSSFEQGIRARESFGKLLARAAAGGIASELELFARSELAKSAAHFLTGDFGGGAAHLAASVALEVGAREIAGAGGGGASGGAGGSPTRDPGTFTPSTNGPGAGGGLTLNLITRDPYGRDSIQQTIYEIGRAGILKRQGIAIPPTSGVNVVSH